LKSVIFQIYLRIYQKDISIWDLNLFSFFNWSFSACMHVKMLQCIKRVQDSFVFSVCTVMYHNCRVIVERYWNLQYTFFQCILRIIACLIGLDHLLNMKWLILCSFDSLYEGFTQECEFILGVFTDSRGTKLFNRT
jgi:hypothetical protein